MPENYLPRSIYTSYRCKGIRATEKVIYFSALDSLIIRSSLHLFTPDTLPTADKEKNAEYGCRESSFEIQIKRFLRAVNIRSFIDCSKTNAYSRSHVYWNRYHIYEYPSYFML